MPDSHQLNRFLTAQQRDYSRALAEIRNGRKVSHWMWYIFPQIDGLGRSSTAVHYAIKSRAEAVAYLDHELLGPRLLEISRALLDVEGRTAQEIFGVPDVYKLRSSMTLFDAVQADSERPTSVFGEVLERYYQNQHDQRTIDLLASGI